VYEVEDINTRNNQHKTTFHQSELEYMYEGSYQNLYVDQVDT